MGRPSSTEVYHQPPCAGCAFATRCAERLLACQHFVDFADGVALVAIKRRELYVGERAPTRELYLRLYGTAAAA
jgi:hypothetical protein